MFQSWCSCSFHVFMGKYFLVNIMTLSNIQKNVMFWQSGCNLFLLNCTTHQYTALKWTKLNSTLHYKICIINNSLHYSTLYSSIDKFTSLHCTKLHYKALHCTTHQYISLHYTTLQYTEPHCTKLHYSVLGCTTHNFTKIFWTSLHDMTTVQ